MSLTKYKQKRSFDKTAEPIGGTPREKKLRFVINKHDASHLHYDFRLVKRLAKKGDLFKDILRLGRVTVRF